MTKKTVTEKKAAGKIWMIINPGIHCINTKVYDGPYSAKSR